MADTTRDIWNDGEEKKQKKPRKLRRFLAFLLVLVAVLAVVLFAAYRDGTGFDVLRRYLNYGGGEQVGSDTVYEYDASANSRFVMLGDRLVVLSDTRLRILGPDGSEVWAVSVNMTAPALESGGGRAVAYDVGGHTLYVLDQNGQLMELTAEENEPFIAATLNEDGWLAVTAKVQGLKGIVSVYDPEMEEVFAFRSSRRFVTDACVLGDGDGLAAVTMGQENSVFVSNVVLYDMTGEDPMADYDISDGLTAAIGWRNDQITVVSDTCLSFADGKGEPGAVYRYDSAYLREFDLGGDGFTALLLNRYQSGSAGRLVTVTPDGTELGALDVAEEVQDISASGRYLAVLYLDRLVIYNENLEIYASLRGTEFARGVLMRPDGSALLLSSEYARLFLP